MSRIYEAFKNKKAFIPFITAGDPNIEKTEEYILRMADAGADLIEIGIPFSDPIAEGIVIQEADIRALASGTTTDKIFDMAGRLRKRISIPLVLMTYLNPVFHYGYDSFFAKMRESGLDGIIIPDMPFEEKHEAKDIADNYGVDVISMIAPTSDERIEMIAKEAEGFVYVVSSMGVTGVRSEIKTDIEAMIKKIKSVTDTPAAVGFGINSPEQAEKISMFADGIIVGSAIMKIIAELGDDAGENIFKYVKSMKNATVRN